MGSLGRRRTLHEQDGSVFAGCPRARLISTLDRLTAAGYTASTGTELEFVLTRPDGTQLDEGPWQGYGIRTALSHGPLLTDLVATFERAGLPLEQIHTEYGRDQIEVSLAPADPLTTADNTVLARILIGRAVARAGYGASFSPVPYAGGVGSGAHLHLSLERGGVPLFSGAVGPYGIASDGGSAIAGIIDWLPELQGVFAGSAVSALRLRPGTWAGAFACWGLENREAAVRFVAATQGNPGGANVEVKAVDGSANPYLVATGLLGAALDGIESKLSLPAEVTWRSCGAARRATGRIRIGPRSAPPRWTDLRRPIGSGSCSATRSPTVCWRCAGTSSAPSAISIPPTSPTDSAWRSAADRRFCSVRRARPSRVIRSGGNAMSQTGFALLTEALTGIESVPDDLADALAGPLVDHHVHTSFRGPVDRPTFEASINEASTDPVPEFLTMFDSPLGFAIRRWCAPLLGLAPACVGRGLSGRPGGLVARRRSPDGWPAAPGCRTGCWTPGTPVTPLWLPRRSAPWPEVGHGPSFASRPSGKG